MGQWDSGQGEVPREHGHQAEAEGSKAQRSRSGVRTADRKLGDTAVARVRTHTRPHSRHPTTTHTLREPLGLRHQKYF